MKGEGKGGKNVAREKDKGKNKVKQNIEIYVRFLGFGNSLKILLWLQRKVVKCSSAFCVHAAEGMYRSRV